MTTKNLICKKFSDASCTYDSASSVHQEIVNHLVVMILMQQKYIGDSLNIVDVGAGTGLLSAKVSDLFSNASISLLDISQSMLDVARSKNTFSKNGGKVFKYINSDAEKIDFQFFKNFDLLCSSMSLHWFNDLYSFLSASFKHCKNVAFSIPILGTFQNWYDILANFGIEFQGIKYKTYDELLEICDLSKFSHRIIEKGEHRMEFESARDFMRYLKCIGANVVHPANDFSSLKKLLELDRKIEVSYNVFYAVLSK
jgi:malonyl-CoA O-methyltransferase